MTAVLPVLADLHRMGVDAFFQPFQMDNIYEENSSKWIIVGIIISYDIAEIYFGVVEAGLSMDASQYKNPTILTSLQMEILQYVQEVVPEFTADNALYPKYHRSPYLYLWFITKNAVKVESGIAEVYVSTDDFVELFKNTTWSQFIQTTGDVNGSYNLYPLCW